MRVHTRGLNGRNGSSAAIKSQFQTSLRAIDRVWVAGDDFVYLLPECDRRQASGFVRRLADSVGIEILATIACFPEDGLTGGLLIELLLDDLEPVEVETPVTAYDSDSAGPVGRGRAALRRVLGRRRATTPERGAIGWMALAPSGAPPGQNGRATDQSDSNPEPALVADAEKAAK